MVLGAMWTSVVELSATVAELVLPRSISTRLLRQVDPFAPHPGTGFEGWYTRIQGDDFTMAIIFCSLAPGTTDSASHRLHYLHFSIIPLNGNSRIKEKIELHLFPPQMTFRSLSKGQLPFTLDAPGFGTFTCHADSQHYNLTLSDETGNFTYNIDVRIRDRVPIDGNNLLRAPHGAFVRLEKTLPLHWAIFSTASNAEVSLKKISSPIQVTANARPVETVLSAANGRAHMEKNWGVSFPQGWTWFVNLGNERISWNFLTTSPGCSRSQGSVASPRGLPSSLAIAGGMILGNKAFMVHYRSKNRNWLFGPPYTIIFAPPRLFGRWGNKRALGSQQTQPTARTSQWGPFASETFDNENGHLTVSLQTLFRKLVVFIESTDVRSLWALDAPDSGTNQ
ncbi:hypothetical protein DL93DRAFT_1175285 [Clavulina sp. PMI_390]|nr:hypothetical protein DL93DRAFT_1175285 [Clavulina sp. PMI_390]